MLSKKLVGTLGVLTATVLMSPAVAGATPSPDSIEAGRRAVLAGTQVGSEGVRPRVVTDSGTGVPMLALDASGSLGEPPNGHLVHLAHGCPNCPHPALSVAGDGIGARS